MRQYYGITPLPQTEQRQGRQAFAARFGQVLIGPSVAVHVTVQDILSFKNARM